MIFLLVLTALVLGLVLAYALWTKDYQHWSKKGVPAPKPIFPYGNVKPVFDAQETFSELFERLIREFPDEPMIGFYSCFEPMLLIVDPELVKQVLVQDFTKFSSQGMILGSGDRLLNGISFWQKTHQAWKELRSRFTPTLTTSKQKGMVPIMTQCTERYMSAHNDPNASKKLTIPDVINLTLRDVMLRIVFSVEVDLLKAQDDPKSEFRTLLDGDVFSNNTNQHLTTCAAFLAPWLHTFLNLRMISEPMDSFYVKFINSIVKQRKSTNNKRDDILQAIVSIERKRLDSGLKGFDEIEWTSNMMTVMVDSTETAALTTTLVLYSIAQHPNEQETMRKEIINYGSSLKDFDYDKLILLKRVEMAILEALRLHSPLQAMARVCSEDTKLGNAIVEKGTKVFIPIVPLHLNPKYHPEPKKFKPDRFLDQSLQHSCTVMPFGEGPRACLGQRYAVLVIKILLIGILLQYNVSLEKPISEEPDKRSPFVTVFKEPPSFVFTPIA